MDEIPIMVLVKEPSLSKFYAHSIIFTPIKNYDAKLQQSSLKSITMGLGVEKFETLVDKKVNFRQIYMINFDYRAQMKL